MVKVSDKDYEIMEEATNFFELSFEKESAPRSYLRDRGLSTKISLHEAISTFAEKP